MRRMVQTARGDVLIREQGYETWLNLDAYEDVYGDLPGVPHA